MSLDRPDTVISRLMPKFFLRKKKICKYKYIV